MARNSRHLLETIQDLRENCESRCHRPIMPEEVHLLEYELR